MRTGAARTSRFRAAPILKPPALPGDIYLGEQRFCQLTVNPRVDSGQQALARLNSCRGLFQFAKPAKEKPRRARGAK